MGSEMCIRDRYDGNNFNNSHENQLAKFLTLSDFLGDLGFQGGMGIFPGYMPRIITDSALGFVVTEVEANVS